MAVGRRPRVAVISTGDELIDVGEPIAAHQVRRSNVYTVAAALTELGYEVDAGHLPDEVDRLTAGMGEALQQHDVLITTGAVSQGSADFLPEVFKSLGVERYLHGVRQRPGKPLWIGGTGAGKRVFALPGNPVSVMACLRRYVVPFLAAAEGATPAPRQCATLVTSRYASGRRSPCSCRCCWRRPPARCARGPRRRKTRATFWPWSVLTGSWSWPQRTIISPPAAWCPCIPGSRWDGAAVLPERHREAARSAVCGCGPARRGESARHSVTGKTMKVDAQVSSAGRLFRTRQP